MATPDVVNRRLGSQKTSSPAKPARPNLLLACLLAGLLAGCTSWLPPSGIRVSEITLFGNLDCFRIETPSATYVLGKRGAGFASILDPDGHDWISYRPEGEAAGEYRGLPKCGQPVKYFHCGYGYGQYTNTNWFTTTVDRHEPGHVRIYSETADHRTAGDWDFFPNHATFTLQRIASTNFWFLYEGTPGGRLDAAGDFSVRPGDLRTPAAEPWEAPAPWVAFGATESPFALLCVNPDTATQTATYVAWPYKPEADGSFQQMTVFGWGRLGWQDPHQHQPQLHTLPARFSIALVRGTAAANLEEQAKAMGRSG